MKNSHSLKQMMTTNPSGLKSIGYYACPYNSLYDLQYCDPGGLNFSFPPDILHAILLGYFTRLINGFAHLKKIDNDSMYVFSDSYFVEIEMDLLAVGWALSKQRDVDLAKTHFPSGYLPDPKKANDNSIEKKCTRTQRCSTYYSLFLTALWPVPETGRPYWWGLTCNICKGNGVDIVTRSLAEQRWIYRRRIEVVGWIPSLLYPYLHHNC